MHFQVGEVPHIVVSSAEIAKEMMKTHDINFSQRIFLHLVGKYFSIDIAFAPYCGYWRMLRKIFIDSSVDFRGNDFEFIPFGYRAYSCSVTVPFRLETSRWGQPWGCRLDWEFWNFSEKKRRCLPDSSSIQSRSMIFPIVYIYILYNKYKINWWG